MRGMPQIWKIIGLTAVLLLGIISLAQAQPSPTGVSGGPTLYLPFVLTSCEDYFDDFSNPASGWQVLDDPDVLLAYTNGEYQVMSRQSGFLFRPLAPAPQRENYVVEVDAHFNAPPTNGLYGLVFGVVTAGTQVTDYYLFSVEPDAQEFRLRRFESGVFTTIQGATVSSAINQGTAVNHLTAVRNGDQIILEVNGTVLGTWVDANITGFTFTGVAQSPNPANPQADARFDNYHVHICYPGLIPSTSSAAFYNTSIPNSVSDPFDAADE